MTTGADLPNCPAQRALMALDSRPRPPGFASRAPETVADLAGIFFGSLARHEPRGPRGGPPEAHRTDWLTKTSRRAAMMSPRDGSRGAWVGFTENRRCGAAPLTGVRFQDRKKRLPPAFGAGEGIAHRDRQCCHPNHRMPNTTHQRIAGNPAEVCKIIATRPNRVTRAIRLPVVALRSPADERNDPDAERRLGR